jgi:hypothetical protein
MSCSELSLAAGEALAGTATTAERWLLVESRGSWGRDAVADSGLPDAVRGLLEAFDGRVQLIRRPDRRAGTTVVHAVTAEGGGEARRLELDTIEELPSADLDAGEPVDAQLLLVCTHGRRDACCARLGVPLFDALGPHVSGGRLWQASHLGGHRFAPNLLALPFGAQFGRIPVDEAQAVAAALTAGRIPLEWYRGRTLYPAPVQAAEIAVRRALGLDGIADLRLLSGTSGSVRFATPDADVTVYVEERGGPAVPASCGGEPEPVPTWHASIV